ncbi:MAG: WXG100 family type VII secretion target [Acidimicrobiia bacterium]|nr:WXG100 family type VII secretion target [Acidimicrobiia bacterium]
MAIRGDGDLIIQCGTNFGTWSGDMSTLLGNITSAVGTLQETWEAVASEQFAGLVEEAMPHLQNLADFMATNSDGLVKYGEDLNYMANTYYVTAGS